MIFTDLAEAHRHTASKQPDN